MERASSHFLHELVAHVRRLRLDADRMLSRCGVTEDMLTPNRATVDDTALCDLVRMLWKETNDTSMGFEKEPIPVAAFAVSSDYMLGAENLAQLYRRFGRMFALIPPKSFGFSFVSDAKQGTVTIHCNVGGRKPNYFWMEFLTIIGHRFPSWAIDEDIKLTEVTFACPPPGHRTVCDRIFKCKVTYNAPTCGFSFCSKYLGRPIQRSKMELQQWLNKAPTGLLDAPSNDSSIRTRIKGELMRALRSEMALPSFEDVCDRLCMSGPVVRRRLAEEGAAFQKIKGQVRCDLVRELLAIEEMGIAEITERAGYTESSTLSRAFKSWTGETPLDYRRRVHQLSH